VTAVRQFELVLDAGLFERLISRHFWLVSPWFKTSAA